MSFKIARPGGETPVRSESSASTGARAAAVYRAHIVNVNTRNYSVDVRLEAYPYSSHYDVPFMVPYVHQAQGEGFSFIPEVGSICWVCSPSETGRDSFVLGWTTVPEDSGYRGGRELLNPGDLHLSTRDGNFVTIRRGGIVQIGATPTCQRIFIPIRNIIRDFAENYELSTPAGDLTWLVSRSDETGDGHKGCLFTLAAKEFADDPNKDPLAVLKIGSHGEGSETIVSLETRDRGGGSTKTKLEIDKAGSIKWLFEQDVTLDIRGNYTSTVKGEMTTTVDGNVKLESKAVLTGKGQEVHLAGVANLDLTSLGAALNGAKVDLGDAMAQVVINSPSFMAWVSAVTAALIGPPYPPVPVFRVPIPPAAPYTSTKAKA